MPQVDRLRSGAARTASISRCRCLSAEEDGTDVAAAGARAPPHPTAPAQISARSTARTATSFGEFVEGFDRFVEVLGLRLRGAGLSGPGEIDVAARLAERDAFFLLVVLELGVDGERGPIEPGLGRRVGERRGADIREA